MSTELIKHSQMLSDDELRKLIRFDNLKLPQLAAQEKVSFSQNNKKQG